MIYIFTDGSVKDTTAFDEFGKRTSPGGLGFVVVTQEGRVLYEEGKCDFYATNNSMELSAIHHALLYINRDENRAKESYMIVSDSQYAVDASNYGEGRANRDLILSNYDLAAGKTHIVWQRKDTSEFNKMAHKIAYSYMKKAVMAKYGKDEIPKQQKRVSPKRDYTLFSVQN